MKITVTMDLTPENLEKLKALCLDERVELETATPAPKAPKNETTAPAESEPETPASPNSSEESAEPDKPITKTDIRAVALKLSKAGKQKELSAIFAKFGCKKLSDFDSRTQDYPALMKELVSIDG